MASIIFAISISGSNLGKKVAILNISYDNTSEIAISISINITNFHKWFECKNNDKYLNKFFRI